MSSWYPVSIVKQIYFCALYFVVLDCSLRLHQYHTVLIPAARPLSCAESRFIYACVHRNVVRKLKGTTWVEEGGRQEEEGRVWRQQVWTTRLV